MNGKVVIGVEADTKDFNEEIKQTEERLKKLEQSYANAIKNKSLRDNQEGMKQLRLEIQRTSNKLVDLHQKQAKIDMQGFNNVQSTIKNVGNLLKKTINTTIRWGLALFGIRSIYMGIRSAVSQITSEDDQIANDIAYMKWIVAQTLKPVVEWMVQALYTVLALVNSITLSLFEFNILAGKSAEAFKQSKKNVGGMANALKDAKKQLAGFDEMNVIQDTKTSGGGTSGGIDNWVAPDLDKKTENVKKKLKDIDEGTKSIGEEIRHYIEDVPWSAWIDAFGLLGISVKGITEIFYGLWSVIKGVFDFLKGIVEVIVGLILGDTELINKGIQDIINGLVEFITGVIYIIIGIVHTVAGVVIEILYEVIMSIWKFIKWLWDGIVNVATSITEFVTKVFTTIGNWIGDRITDLINFFKSIPGIVKSVFDLVWNFIKGVVSKIISLFKEIGTKVGDVIGGAFKSVINGVLSAVENILNAPIKAINKLINKINDIPGINLKTLSTFNLPRLAKGGIINMPGRGVMVGNAIAGERAAEGVIPLTDSQQMALLGEAIGKYININATIPVYVGNRQVARELRKIDAEDNFAFNR